MQRQEGENVNKEPNNMVGEGLIFPDIIIYTI